VRNIVKEIRLKGKYILEEQLKNKELEYKELLEAKETELAKYKKRTYEEIDKTGHVYVIGTDHSSYKIGKTKDVVTKRIRSLQTANANDIKVYLDFKTSNPDILERSVHYILDRYRCNSNREFFDCDLNYIKMIVTLY
jgi:leucyl aminopeptidase (aminopeptidase T)